MPHGLMWDELVALLQVVLIDLTLAGDNAVVVGMAVAGLPAPMRRVAIVAGVGGAALLRIALGTITLQLLAIVGLLLAGGLLLLWVCWKMYRELRGTRHGHAAAPAKTLGAAMAQIVLADLSMSLDNVLAVAGAAGGHVWVLATGLALSVVLMGVAANLVARLLVRHRWIAWIGLAIVLFVALRLIWDGGHEVAAHFAGTATSAAPPAGS
jgi:YjbE family integral membrane protein